MRDRPDERQLAFLRQYQQQVLLSQQHKLAIAVAAILPLALAVLQVNAREKAAVEPERMTLENAPIGSQRRLQDSNPWPRVLPKQRAVVRRDAGHALPAELQNLFDSVEHNHMRRAVAPSVSWTEPARLAGSDVAGDELAGRSNDDQVVEHQRRT